VIGLALITVHYCASGALVKQKQGKLGAVANCVERNNDELNLNGELGRWFPVASVDRGNMKTSASPLLDSLQTTKYTASMIDL